MDTEFKTVYFCLNLQDYTQKEPEPWNNPEAQRVNIVMPHGHNCGQHHNMKARLPLLPHGASGPVCGMPTRGGPGHNVNSMGARYPGVNQAPCPPNASHVSYCDILWRPMCQKSDMIYNEWYGMRFSCTGYGACNALLGIAVSTWNYTSKVQDWLEMFTSRDTFKCDGKRSKEIRSTRHVRKCKCRRSICIKNLTFVQWSVFHLMALHVEAYTVVWWYAQYLYKVKHIECKIYTGFEL